MAERGASDTIDYVSSLWGWTSSATQIAIASAICVAMSLQRVQRPPLSEFNDLVANEPDSGVNRHRVTPSAPSRLDGRTYLVDRGREFCDRWDTADPLLSQTLALGTIGFRGFCVSGG